MFCRYGGKGVRMSYGNFLNDNGPPSLLFKEYQWRILQEKNRWPHIDLVPNLSMRGPVFTPQLSAFMACGGTTLFYNTS